MADLDDIKDGKDWGEDSPVDVSRFFLKGSEHYDWGMKARLSNIFRPESGRTVMLAFDHGYFQGPTTGLERLDLSIAPLAPYTDVLMCTRGALRTVIRPETKKPVVLRCSAGNSILTELSNELISVEIDDAIRLGASAMAAQVYIGAEYEHKSIANVVKLIDIGTRYGIPTMAVTGVGADMVRDARYFGLATRIAAEIGSQLVKSYYVEDGFEKIVLGCPVPIVIAGGKKLPERDALEMAYRAINQGAAGVDMGRNVFQSSNPVGMLQALEQVVHHDMTGEEAYALFQDATPLKVA
ncbi:3-hydroxy-5-phosphonooxypentane-2,4-dione thiolase [Pararhizobium sp. IMCC21322]|uniref:3-hydroxy-5-phosphonooxypentane-2,4-dione thiolase n=1 Tax=Pararhizobium sp. IMCC21322 TaxID=3067903 RepID=UPI00274157F1|nr:3-hydroxy-5-phosphonooxypentane-2,4-dione thiolase [Pararhizobium sp. IMCC21322]